MAQDIDENYIKTVNPLFFTGRIRKSLFLEPDIPLRISAEHTLILNNIYSQRLISSLKSIITGPIIHIPKKCSTCNGTKKVLLLYSYVDCVDC